MPGSHFISPSSPSDILCCTIECMKYKWLKNGYVYVVAPWYLALTYRLSSCRNSKFSSRCWDSGWRLLTTSREVLSDPGHPAVPLTWELKCSPFQENRVFGSTSFLQPCWMLLFVSIWSWVFTSLTALLRDCCMKNAQGRFSLEAPCPAHSASSLLRGRVFPPTLPVLGCGWVAWELAMKAACLPSLCHKPSFHSGCCCLVSYFHICILSMR